MKESSLINSRPLLHSLAQLRFISFFTLFLSIFFNVKAQANCEDILKQAQRNEVVEFARYIHKSNPDFYKSTEVRSQQKRLEKAGVKLSSQPQEMIASWLEALEKTHGSAIGNERVKNKIEEYYFKEHVIKREEIPDSYYETQKRIAREEGRGNIALSENAKKELADTLIQDQKESLKKWLDYLLSTDANYPFWKKYWSFTSLLKMGAFDVGKGLFQKRSKGQVALFPELNQEALAKVFDQVGEGKSNDYNFAKKYALEFNQIRLDELNVHDELTKIEGKWIKYDKGSDESKLVESLENKGTGWCTAGRETAKTQLSKGDFHVFYSLDVDGNPTIPRVAIRLENTKIVEIRGRDKNQNLDSKIAGSNIVEEKLKEFGNEGEQYQKRSSDMKFLTLIEKKIEEETELSKEELVFLYELEGKIEGFGYRKDPRIREIVKKRNIKKDLSLVLNVDPSRISTNEDAALSGNIFYHYGDLVLDYVNTAKDLSLPQNMSGSLILSRINSAEGLILPSKIGGSLDLRGLNSVKDLKLPNYIGENLDLFNLSSAEELKLPDYIGGTLNLFNLISVKKLTLPSFVGKEINLSGLSSAKGLQFPTRMRGTLSLDGLTTIVGLNLPSHINGNLNISKIKSAEGLRFPEYVSGSIRLYDLTTSDGLNLPKYVGGDIFIKNNLPLKLPQTFKGKVHFGI